jgi:hypothetical protein
MVAKTGPGDYLNRNERAMENPSSRAAAGARDPRRGPRARGAAADGQRIELKSFNARSSGNLREV